MFQFITEGDFVGDFLSPERSLLGEILHDFRKENGYTQKEISDYLGVDRSTYAKYESNRKPELDIIIQLAAFYGVSVDGFLGDYRDKTVSGKNVEPFSKVSSPESGENGSCLSLEELRLLNLFRKSIRKNEIISFARRIASEDSDSK
ncbi:MAG: helix-turn-helix transcriptional regulator [Clostridia bacterium]|nr:helix-turn-helix transcriptional regulator [Clostridia bacterium]MBQ3007694.1 helix-turn-helix transcriptional regulator [Clostridia bacterium]